MIATAILRQILAVEPLQGESASGPLYGDAVSYPARLEPKRRVVRSAEDTVIVSDALAYLRPEAEVAVGDRVTCEGVAYRVLGVEVARELARAHHLTVSLGRSAT